jgi:hypothetical protein
VSGDARFGADRERRKFFTGLSKKPSREVSHKMPGRREAGLPPAYAM